MGVVVKRHIDILTIIITFPYSTCISSFFCSSIPTSLLKKKKKVIIKSLVSCTTISVVWHALHMYYVVFYAYAQLPGSTEHNALRLPPKYHSRWQALTNTRSISDFDPVRFLFSNLFTYIYMCNISYINISIIHTTTFRF